MSQKINTSLVHQKGETTHNIFVDSIMFAWHGLISEVMSYAINAEHKIFLERPSSDVTRKLFISRLLASRKKKEKLRLYAV